MKLNMGNFKLGGNTMDTLFGKKDGMIEIENLTVEYPAELFMCIPKVIKGIKTGTKPELNIADESRRKLIRFSVDSAVCNINEEGKVKHTDVIIDNKDKKSQQHIIDERFNITLTDFSIDLTVDECLGLMESSHGLIEVIVETFISSKIKGENKQRVQELKEDIVKKEREIAEIENEAN